MAIWLLWLRPANKQVVSKAAHNSHCLLLACNAVHSPHGPRRFISAVAVGKKLDQIVSTPGLPNWALGPNADSTPLLIDTWWNCSGTERLAGMWAQFPFVGETTAVVLLSKANRPSHLRASTANRVQVKVRHPRFQMASYWQIQPMSSFSQL